MRNVLGSRSEKIFGTCTETRRMVGPSSLLVSVTPRPPSQSAPADSDRKVNPLRGPPDPDSVRTLLPPRGDDRPRVAPEHIGLPVPPGPPPSIP